MVILYVDPDMIERGRAYRALISAGYVHEQLHGAMDLENASSTMSLVNIDLVLCRNPAIAADQLFTNKTTSVVTSWDTASVQRAIAQASMQT